MVLKFRPCLKPYRQEIACLFESKQFCQQMEFSKASSELVDNEVMISTNLFWIFNHTGTIRRHSSLYLKPQSKHSRK